MARTSLVHYIAPSAISLTPNCNGSANDIAVYISRGAKIRVYSEAAGIPLNGSGYQEWTLTGRNRRLADSTAPYTIYARLLKADVSNGYLVFVKKQQVGGVWKDKYPYVIKDAPGLYMDVYGQESQDYYYIRLGDVSLPQDSKREITLDTGILGTPQYNEEWNENPDNLPLRVEIGCTVADEDAGPTPYVFWGQSLVLTALLVKGWDSVGDARLDHWEIQRNSDSDWPDQQRAEAFAQTGVITINHSRGQGDDFQGAVQTLFNITAWGYEDSDSSGTPVLVELGKASVCILAETIETFDLVKSSEYVNYNPMTGAYVPASGIDIGIRATDQKGDVFDVTVSEFSGMGLQLSYAPVGSEQWTPLTVSGQPQAVAMANIPVSVFHQKQSINVRLTRTVDGDTPGTVVTKELKRSTVAFVADGEDTNDREWIYKQDNATGYDSKTGTAHGQAVSGKTGDDWNADLTDDFVPTGWSDNALPVSAQHPDVYTSWRDYDREHDKWGDFQAPIQWSHWGEQGTDGDGVQYLYKLFDHELTDAERISNIPENPVFNPTTKEWEAAGWYDDPQAPTGEMPFCYCSIIQHIAGQWGTFQKLGMWSKWSEDGRDAAACTVGRQAVFVPTDAEGRVLEDFDIIVPFRVMVGSSRAAVTDATLTEEGTGRYATIFGGIVQDVTGTKITVTGTKAFVTGATVSGTKVSLDSSFRAGPSGVRIKVAKGALLDEHMVNLTVTAVDGDGATYVTYGGIEILGNTYAKDGDTPISVYKWTQSPDTAPAVSGNAYPPSGWSKTAPNRPEGEGWFLWVSNSVKRGDGTILDWGTPVRISGDTGSAGEDAKEREWIYKRSDSNPGTPENPSDRTIDDYVPAGWSDNPLGVDVDHKTEWASWRDFDHDTGLWGDFHSPVVWSHYGRNGMDGDGVEYVFIRTNSNVAPTIVNSPDSRQDSHGHTYLDDEYLPLASGGSLATQTECTDDPQGVTQALRYEWVIKRTKGAPDAATGVRAWEKYSGAMSIWTRWSENAIHMDLDNEMDAVTTDSTGKLTAARTITTIATIYDGASVATDATLVSTAASLNIAGVTPTLSISDGVITATWAFTTAATLAAAATVTIIAQYKGLDYQVKFTLTPSMGGAILQLKPSMTSMPFARNSDNTLTPASYNVGLEIVKLDGASTDTYTSATAAGVTVRYSTQAMPSSATAGTAWTSGTINVPSSATALYIAMFNSAGTLLDRETIPAIKDGNNGAGGPAGGNTATVMLYKRSASAVTSVGISATLYYKFSTKKLYTDAACTTEATTQLNGWSLTIPNNSTDQIYVTAAIAFSNTASDDIAGNEWVTPAQFTENGEPGAHGINSATVFLYKRSATAISSHGITTTLYYNFTDGKLYTKSGSTYTEATAAALNNWEYEIPTANGNPCYVIQAAALSNEDYDQIATTDWSSVRKLVEDGKNGRGITGTNIYYTASATAPATPSGAPTPSGWDDDGNTFITAANASKHLYESTCTTYSDGTYSWTAPLDDGLISDIAATSEEFALADSGSTAPTSGWDASVTPTAGKWIWSRTKLTFKSGNPSYVNTQCVGYCGTNGRGISSTNIYYTASATAPSTPSGAPTPSGWDDDGNTFITAANASKHLYESTCTTYSDGTYSWTAPLDDGLISDIAATSEEFALADSGSTAPTSGWDASVTPTAGKWIWSRTKLTFKSGNPSYVNTQCVGYCGTNGRGISSTNIYYTASATAPSTPSGAPTPSGWDDDGNTFITAANASKHLYESTCTTYTDSTYSWTTPLDDGLISDIAVTSEEFALGTSGTTAPTSGWAASVTPVPGKWVWSRTKLTFKSGNPSYVNTQCVGYCGEDGDGTAICIVDRQAVFVPTDSTGKVIEAFSLVVNFKVQMGNAILAVKSATVNEGGTQHYVQLFGGKLANGKMSVSGTKVSLVGTVSGTKVSLGSSYVAGPSGVIIKVAKGVTLDEHLVGINVSSVDKDGKLYTAYGSFEILGKSMAKDGTSQVAVFKWSTSGTSAPAISGTDYPPAGWSVNPPSRPEGDSQFLWASYSTRYSDGTIAGWGTPVRISGNDGSAGEDAKEREWIYKRSNSNPGTPENPSDRTIDDYVPSGWSDNPAGVDDSHKTEWASWRDFDHDTQLWGDFQAPIQWSHWGERGMDGDGVEYVFIRTNSNVAPTIVNSPDSRTDSRGHKYTDDEYLPLASGGTLAAQTECTDDPTGTDSDHQFEWVAKRIKVLNADGKTRTWQKYSGAMAGWANWSEDGDDAYSVKIEPADIMFTQSTTKNSQGVYPLVDPTKTATITVKKGNSNDAVAHTTAIQGTPSGCTASVSGDTVTVTGVIGNYTEGSVTVRVAITNGPTFDLKLNVYYNLLGTWKESVEGGVKTIVADEVDYEYLDDVLTKNNRSYTQTASAAGQYDKWQSDTASVSGSKADMIQKTTTAQATADGVKTEVTAIKTGKNMLKGALSGSNFRCETTLPYPSHPAVNPKVDDNGWMTATGYTSICTSATIEKGKDYVLSFYTKYTSAFNVTIWKPGTTTSDWTLYKTLSVAAAGATVRRSVTFNITTEGVSGILICIPVTTLRYPQLELGTTATAFEVDSATETSSRISQSASHIEEKVGDCGIDIDEKTITLTAEKTIINGELTVPRVMNENENMITTCEAGVVKVQSKTTSSYGVFAINSLGEVVLQMYDKDGGLVLNLGGTPNIAVNGEWRAVKFKRVDSGGSIADTRENFTATDANCDTYYRLILGTVMNSGSTIQYYLPNGNQTTNPTVIGRNNRVFISNYSTESAIATGTFITDGYYVEKNDGIFMQEMSEYFPDEYKYFVNVYHYESGKITEITKHYF